MQPFKAADLWGVRGLFFKDFMTTGEFADKVFTMRQAQKNYFKYRSKSALELYKQLEKEVDDILFERKKRLKNEPKNDIKQGVLFD